MVRLALIVFIFYFYLTKSGIHPYFVPINPVLSSWSMFLFAFRPPPIYYADLPPFQTEELLAPHLHVAGRYR